MQQQQPAAAAVVDLLGLDEPDPQSGVQSGASPAGGAPQSGPELIGPKSSENEFDMSVEESLASSMSINELKTLASSVEAHIQQMTAAYATMQKNAEANPDDFALMDMARKQRQKMNKMRLELVIYIKNIKQKEEKKMALDEATQSNKEDLGVSGEHRQDPQLKKK